MPAREWRGQSRQRRQHPENIRKLLPRAKANVYKEGQRTGNMTRGGPTERFIGKNGAQTELLPAPWRDGKPWDPLPE